MHEVDLSPGTVVGGYVIEAVAGRGGMGIVYRARQERPSRTVALKVIAPRVARDASFRRRFQRESDLAAVIEHPNVIPVYEVGDAEGLLFIAMRYVEGTDMAELIDRQGRLDPHLTGHLIGQVAAALDAGHERGLVHRDVKPANVLIAGRADAPHAYLTDFGLAKTVEADSTLTDAGKMVGTVDYMAPEQITGEPATPRTDVYALGCVLFKALTGRVPYPAEGNKMAKLFAHTRTPVPSATELVPELPAALDDVVRRAMAKDPADRFASAGEMSQATIAAAAQPPGRVAAGSPAPAPIVRHGRRRLIVAGAAVALVAAAAAAIVFAVAGGGDDGDDDPTTARNTPPPTIQTTAPDPERVPAGERIVSDPANGRTSVVVGWKDTPEQRVIGEIYAQTLDAAGFQVKKRPALGESVVALTIQTGEVDAYPEETSPALEILYGVGNDDIPRDPGQALALLNEQAKEDGMTPLPQTPFDNRPVLVSTAATAQEIGNPETMSAVASSAGDSRTVAGTAFCEPRSDCYEGLTEVYSWSPSFARTTTPFAAVDSGQADFALVDGVSPELAQPGRVVYRDDEGMASPHNVTLFARERTARAIGDDGRDAIESVQGPLTDAVMRDLNRRVAVDREPPEDVARSYLRDHGFIG